MTQTEKALNLVLDYGSAIQSGNLHKSKQAYAALKELLEAPPVRPVGEALYATNVLAWLHLPKNPLADAWVIAQRVYVEKDEPESYGEYRLTVGCWWAGGMYYPAGHVTGWMPLPPKVEAAAMIAASPEPEA